MLTAEEAFKETLAKIPSSETIDHLLVCEQRIKEAVSQGIFAIYSEPMSVAVAEKLAIELEEFGYATSPVGTSRFTAENQPLVAVGVTWRYKPSVTSRVEAATSYN